MAKNWVSLRLILGLLLFAALIEPIDAFIGNKIFGSKLCVVGCGRGPLGIAPLERPIKDINKTMFGPTVDNFEAAGKRVVDYAGSKADEQIKQALQGLEAVVKTERKQLDQSLTDRINDVGAVMQDSVVALDETLRKGLEEGDRLLEARFGSLKTIGTTQLAALETTVHRLLVFAAILAFIWFVITRIYPDFAANRSQSKGPIALKLAAGVAGVVVLYLSYYLLPNQKTVETLRANHTQAYESSIAELDFRGASFHATQLQAIDFFDKRYANYTQKSALLKDVFVRPTSYKTIEGLAELERGISTLLDELSKREERDLDVEAMLALVSWQSRRDRFTQYLVANASAQMLDQGVQDAESKRFFALAPLAIHYLSTYLAYPMTDRELELLGKTSTSIGKLESDDGIYLRLYQLWPHERLRQSLQAAIKDKRIAMSRQHPLFSHITYGNITSKLYKEAVPLYFAMASLQASLATEADPIKQKSLIEARSALAKRVVTAWDEWLGSVADSSLDLSVSNRATILQGLHATYARAKAYAASSAIEIPKPATAPADLFHSKWLETAIRGYVRPQGLRVLQLFVTRGFVDDELRLVAFEQSLVEARKAIATGSGESTPKAQAAAAIAAELGLFACRTPDLVCAKADDPINAVWLIQEQVPTTLRPADSSWKSLLEASLTRTIPVL